MRDRQPIGNVLQQEVIEATCASAQVPTVAVVLNANIPDPGAAVPPAFYPAPSPSLNNIPRAPLTAG
jgi:hypothetical protein